MVAQLVGKGAKAWGVNRQGGFLHPADAERWDSGWLPSFEDAMLRAREWADQQGIETIYVEYELVTQEEHDAVMSARLDDILRK
jgi:hypothetical protein